jgi:hypothetical protein
VKLLKSRDNFLRNATNDGAELARGASLSKTLHLVRRKDRFWFRMTIPEPLREVIGRREFAFSLKTTDHVTAKRRASIETVKALAKIDEARRKTAVEASKSAPVVLSEGECWQLAVKWFIQEEKRPIGAPKERAEEAMTVLGLMAGDPEQELVRKEVHRWLNACGYSKIAHGSHELLVDFMMRAWVEHEKRILNRVGSHHLPLDPRFADSRLSAEPAIPLDELLKRYRKQQKPNRTAKTKLKEPFQDALFCEFFGGKTPISAITREHTLDFEAFLDRLPANATKKGISIREAIESPVALAAPISPKTHGEHISTLAAVFTLAVKEGYLARSPIGAWKRRPDEVRQTSQRGRRNGSLQRF